MQFLSMFALVVLIILGTAFLFLKFIRSTVLNCLSIKNVTWSTVKVKFIDCKIAVEISALTLELLLLSGHAPQLPVQRVRTSSEKLPNLNQNINSTATMILRIISTHMKSFLSYLLSFFTIVLTQCAFRLEMSEGDQIAVRKNEISSFSSSTSFTSFPSF